MSRRSVLGEQRCWLARSVWSRCDAARAPEAARPWPDHEQRLTDRRCEVGRAGLVLALAARGGGRPPPPWAPPGRTGDERPALLVVLRRAQATERKTARR